MSEHEIIVDGFAGGGGTSTGVEMALGRSPDVAMNHDEIALAMHEVNHPDTLHLLGDIWDVDPRAATGGRPVGLGWFSPDCKHFSKAKGGKPVDKQIRSLAWVVVHWANLVRPRVIILENVEEFATWGPLGADNKPCPLNKGATFKRWVGELERLGYVVEWKELRACDYGAPTIRKRLFLIARRDGAPIVWPEPTHGDPKSDGVKAGRLKPWRTAAEIIDWSLPCPSIFATSEAIMAEHGLRAIRPLQPATMARIAKGVRRYVLDAISPFIVNLTHHGEGQAQGVVDPLATVTAAHRGEKAIVTPFISAAQQGGSARAATVPAHTLTASRKDQNQVVAPYIARTAHGDADARGKKRGQGTHSVQDPHGTVLGSNDHAVIAPVISAYYGKGEGEDGRAARVDDPLRTQPCENRHALVAPYLVPRYGERPGQEPRTRSVEVPAPVIVPTGNGGSLVAPHLMTMRNADKPHQGADMPTHTVTAGGAHTTVVAAFLAQNNVSRGDGINPGRAADKPVSTILHSGSHQAVVAANLLRQFGTGVGSSVHEPTRTVMADGQGKTQLSTAFLSKYYGADQDPRLEDPLHTATSKARFGLAEVLLRAPPFGPEHHARARKVADLLRAYGLWDDREFVTVDIEGVTCVIVDLGLRMFKARELFRAQGFPDSYVIDRRPDGTPITLTDQVRMCGNSVSPPMAAALVGANVPELSARREAA